MVGGTKLPPQDSQSEPGCYERKTRATARTKAKTLHEGKRQKPSQVYVSLDNADTVIEGGPSRPPLAGWGFSSSTNPYDRTDGPLIPWPGAPEPALSVSKGS